MIPVRNLTVAVLGPLLLTPVAVYADQSFTTRIVYDAGPAAWIGDLTPISESDWSYERAAHLLERAGFGGRPEAVEKLAGASPEEAVDYLLHYETIPNNHLPAFEESGIWSEAMLPHVNENFDFRDGIVKARETGNAYGAVPKQSGVRPFQPIINMLYYRNYATRLEWNRASEWWANRMLNTHRPLEEKMTLFWHGHFSTEQEKVRDYRLMLDQVDMLRTNATGNFRDLLIGIAKDPAMLVYLDNRKNVKGNANENFAREIMELFALGVGNYTEDDIKEAARAFTGWGNYGRTFVDNPEDHDGGEKAVLGRTGNFDGIDVIDILLEQEVCAEFISGKIYRYLVSEELSPELNEKLAAVFRDNHYELKPLLRTILLSRDFYSPPAYATQIKSPVHYLVSTYARLGLKEVPGIPNFTYVSSALGQALGNPPNVAGWDGGRSWINPSTLVERGNVVRHLLFPAEAEGQYDLGPFAGRYQRYVNAHEEVLERDRKALLASSGAMPMMQMEGSEGGMTMDAPSANMINDTPEYDLPYGVYNGMSRAYATVYPPSQSPAEIRLVGEIRDAGAETVTEVVSYFERLLLRVPLPKDAHDSMIAFLAKRVGGDNVSYTTPGLETDLRDLMHMIMSTPEYQLG